MTESRTVLESLDLRILGSDPMLEDGQVAACRLVAAAADLSLCICTTS